jgi:hypothetical protein
MARVPEFGQEPAMGGRPWIELHHLDTGLRALITNRTIGITMPYGGGDATLEVAAECGDALAEAGFAAYDPQAGRIVTRADFGIDRR